MLADAGAAFDPATIVASANAAIPGGVALAGRFIFGAQNGTEYWCETDSSTKKAICA
jgi:hypothetical protein